MTRHDWVTSHTAVRHTINNSHFCDRSESQADASRRTAGRAAPDCPKVCRSCRFVHSRRLATWEESAPETGLSHCCSWRDLLPPSSGQNVLHSPCYTTTFSHTTHAVTCRLKHAIRTLSCAVTLLGNLAGNRPIGRLGVGWRVIL